MANALSHGVWRTSEPGRIDADLARLWREVAREEPVSRAVLSNLLVFCEQAADNPVDLSACPRVPLEEVLRRHPSRAIVFHHDSGEAVRCGLLGVSVAVHVFGPPRARYGVETIAVQSACTEA